MTKIVQGSICFAVASGFCMMVACGDSGGTGSATLDVPRDCEADKIEAKEDPLPSACDTGVVGNPTEAFDPYEYVDGLEFATPPPVVETDPAKVGHWTDLIEAEGYVPIHSVHRPTGHYLHLGAKDNGAGGYALYGEEHVWFTPAFCTPLDNTNGVADCESTTDIEAGISGVQSRKLTPYAGDVDLFCSGHTNVLPEDTNEATDGPRTLLVGGSTLSNANDGVANADIFRENYSANGSLGTFDWEGLTGTDDRRWYPTVTVLPDGRFLASGGWTLQPGLNGIPAFNHDAEILTRQPNDTFTWSPPEEDAFGTDTHLYPFAFVLPDLDSFANSTELGGKVFFAGANDFFQGTTRIYDQNESTYAPLGGPSCTSGSSAVMYEPGKIMKFGGSLEPSRMTEVIDFTSSGSGKWEKVASTSMPRRHSAGIILPDGTVFALGGTVYDNSGDYEPKHVVFTTELFDPDNKTWCRLADLPGDPYPTYRGYHSQSFLMRDGRVYLGAGGVTANADEHYDYQLYSPPYLFKGPRPEISIPANTFIQAGSQTPVTITRLNEVTVSKVNLVKLSSSTHHWDMEQRFINLDIDQIGEDQIEVIPPESTCYATPGPYMVFAISDLGVPSIGQYVYVDGSCAAAEEPAEPPAQNGPLKLLNRASTGALVASCSSETGNLTLESFNRTIEEVCSALGCPSNGTVDLEARLIRSSTQSVPSGGTLLDTATVTFTDDVPAISDPLEVTARGSTWNSSFDLGAGEHVVELCAELGILSGCIEQDLHVEQVISDGTGSIYRAAPIERNFIRLDGMPGVHTIAATGDNTELVDFGRGFSFPFFGTNYGFMYVGVNGGLRFASGSLNSSNSSLPVSSSGGPAIAPYWDDLKRGTNGKVLWRHFGDRIVVSWEGVEHDGGTATAGIWFQVHLLRSGRIEFHYKDTNFSVSGLSDGASATIGVQGSSSTVALSTNSTTLLSAGVQGLAIEQAHCIGSPIRAAAGSSCDRAVTIDDSQVTYTCDVNGTVSIDVPSLPTLCATPHGAFIKGVIDTPNGPVEVVDGTAVLPIGVYELSWMIMDSLNTPSGSAFASLAGPFTQELQVTTSRAGSVCCSAEQDPITLTSSADIVDTSSQGAVCVDALAGDDDITVSDDDNVVMGGSNDDVVTGGDGADKFLGGSGHDGLAGGDGADTLFGDAGDDRLLGEGGADTLLGGAGDDGLEGGIGNDRLLPGSGADYVDAGSGDDWIMILHSCEVISGKVLDGGANNDTLFLPQGITLTDLTTAGVTVSNIETVSVLPEGVWGVSDCDPVFGSLASE